MYPWHPDLITLDVMMPDINGFDVVTSLKKNPGTANIPISMISVVEHQDRGYRLSVADYVTKPFKVEEIIERVGKLLGDENGIPQSRSGLIGSPRRPEEEIPATSPVDITANDE